MRFKYLKPFFITLILIFLLIAFFLRKSQVRAPLINDNAWNPDNNQEVEIMNLENKDELEVSANSQVLNETNIETINTSKEVGEVSKEKEGDKGDVSEELNTKKIILAVPFTSQAPFGDWSDSRQQDGCEEASVLMAIKWARQESLTRETALKEILAASDYILEKYGEYRDTDLEAVLNWLIYDYFNYEKAEIKKNITIKDLIAELKKDRVIIAPMNGQALKNPNFTAPGPINHMLLIRGYDPIKKTFITNDPGTRQGELYEYNENILFSALRTYPTGYHEPNNNPEKNVIVFWR